MLLRSGTTYGVPVPQATVSQVVTASDDDCVETGTSWETIWSGSGPLFPYEWIDLNGKCHVGGAFEEPQ